jgi:hypothetical protein
LELDGSSHRIRRRDSWDQKERILGSGGENPGIRRRESWDEEESTGISRRMSCE